MINIRLITTLTGCTAVAACRSGGGSADKYQAPAGAPATPVAGS